MNNSTFEAELAEKGKIIFPNRGVSMRPLIREGKDLMIIEKPRGRLKRYDGALYKRKDGSYILHRVLKVRENDYVICGDNCVKKEYGITDEMILGVLTGVIRNGRELSATDKRYRLYVHLWCDLFYLRVAILYLVKIAKRLLRPLKRLIKRRENK